MGYACFSVRRKTKPYRIPPYCTEVIMCKPKYFFVDIGNLIIEGLANYNPPQVLAQYSFIPYYAL
jgi:hypothetical protein